MSLTFPLWCVSWLAILVVQQPTADPSAPSASAAGAPSTAVEDALLRDLLDGSESAAPGDGTPGSNNTPLQDPPRLQQPPAGEDVGRGSQASPLRGIGQQMLAAQRLLASDDTSDRTQRLQRQIVADLSKMIDQMQSQQSASQTESTEPTGQAAPADTDQPGGGDPGTASVATGSQLDPLQAMMRRIWGHLPDRVRQQMQSPLEDEYLPRYEDLIQEYYKRLAEENFGTP